MAKNQKLPNGLEISLPVPSGIKSGDPVKVGSLVGVAIVDRGTGGNASTHATVWRHRTWMLPLAEEVTEAGTPVYITDANALTLVGTDATLFGYVLEPKTAADVLAHVVIAQV